MGSPRNDYALVSVKNGLVQVDRWQNKDYGGTMVRGDGTFYCDMTGSGSDDYVFINATGAITLFENDHNWGYWVPWGVIYNANIDRQVIQLADFDGDGKCDILLVEQDTGTTIVIQNLYSNGVFKFKSLGVMSGIATCTTGRGRDKHDQGTRWADIDGDGRADFLCMDTDGVTTGFLNKGSGSFANQGLIKHGEGKERVNLRFADINGDGRADLLYVNSTDGAVTAWYNGGAYPSSGSAFEWDWAGIVSTGGTSRGATIEFGQLYGDGRADYISVEPASNKAWTWFNVCPDGGVNATTPNLPSGAPPAPLPPGASSGVIVTKVPQSASDGQSASFKTATVVPITTTDAQGSTITTTSTISGGVVITTTNSAGAVITTTSTPAIVTYPITSTMTTLPPEVSIQDFTNFPITTNIWLTTTGSDKSTTIVPVLIPCPTCQPEIVWKVPEVVGVEFSWPSIPKLPKWHFPCIKIFGIHIAGECPSPSGPPPILDGLPLSPQASKPSSISSCSSTTVQSCAEDCSVLQYSSTTYTECATISCTSVVACSTHPTTITSTTTYNCAALPAYTSWWTATDQQVPMLGDGGDGGTMDGPDNSDPLSGITSPIVAMTSSATTTSPVTTTATPATLSTSKPTASSTGVAPPPSPSIGYALYLDDSCRDQATTVTLTSLNTCNVPLPAGGWISMRRIQAVGLGSAPSLNVFTGPNCGKTSFAVDGTNTGCITLFNNAGCSQGADCTAANSFEWLS
ncbi:hypothetical protein LTR17_011313 [Elasticomyces elasticus]|nr:hypothetical protein LTR17_011313 [Elasticomyces elasticus]